MAHGGRVLQRHFIETVSLSFWHVFFDQKKKRRLPGIEEADAKEEEYQSQSYVQSAALYFLEEAVSWLWQN